MAAPPSGRWRQVLGNPFVLGAGALVIAVAAGIGVAVALGRGGTDTVAIVLPEIAGKRTPTPRAEGEVRGLRARATTTLTVRAGPGPGFIGLGVVPRGVELEVVAKSDSEQWLKVIYPPRSRLRGWVQLEDVEFSGDLAALTVGGAEVFVLPEVPTAVPIEEATPMPEVPDLIPSDAFVAGDFLVVTVTNNGTVGLVEQVIEVGIFDSSLSQSLAEASAGPLSLAPGESVDISTGFQVTDSESQRVVVVVDPQGKLGEGDYSNNSLVFVLGGGGATETPGPEGATPTAGPEESDTPTPTVIDETPTPSPP